MAKWECLLKVSNNAEPYNTYFDPEKNRLVDEFGWVSGIDVRDLFNYSSDLPVQELSSRDMLYDIMLSYSNSRLLINGPGNKFILVTDKVISPYEEGRRIQPLYDLTLPIIGVPFQETGCVLAPCFTFNVMQRMYKLAFVTACGQSYIMTRFGLRNVTGVHDDLVHADDSVKITPAMLLGTGRDIYAGYAVNGEIKYIYSKEVRA